MYVGLSSLYAVIVFVWLCVLSVCLCRYSKSTVCSSCLKKSNNNNTTNATNTIEYTNPLLQTNPDDPDIEYYRTGIRNSHLRRFGITQHTIRKRSPSPETLFPLRKNKSKKIRTTDL